MTFKRFALIVVKNGLLFLALVATALVSAVATMRVVLRSQEVVVPSLVQKRVREATALARRQGLDLRIEGKRYDGTVPADRILTQEPAPGARLKSQRALKVWLSLGPRQLTVPAVEGQTVRAARVRLDQANIPVGRIIEVDSPTAAGTILVQRPPPGVAEADFELVSLLVSRGSGADYVMPDLIGRKAEDVLERLGRAGLKVVDVRYRAYPGVAPGIVLRQLPPSGHRVSPQESVSLDISKATS